MDQWGLGTAQALAQCAGPDPCCLLRLSGEVAPRPPVKAASARPSSDSGGAGALKEWIAAGAGAVYGKPTTGDHNRRLAANVLFLFVSARYERASMIVTASNKVMSGGREEIFGARWWPR
jgi:hypothetical protein